MTEITSLYEGDLHTRCVHLESGAQILTDAPKDNQGLGREFSPTDLVAAALISCTLTIMGITARKLNIDLKGTHAKVIKEMQTLPQRRISKLTVQVNCPYRFDEPLIQKLIAAAESCPVLHSLHPDIQVKINYTWGIQA